MTELALRHRPEIREAQRELVDLAREARADRRVKFRCERAELELEVVERVAARITE